MARDVLCIPLSGTSVERVFNIGRDICGYRRGHLNPSTIRSLVLLSCQLRSDEKQEKLKKESLLEEISNILPFNELPDEEIEDEYQIRLHLLQDRLDFQYLPYIAADPPRVPVPTPRNEEIHEAKRRRLEQAAEVQQREGTPSPGNEPSSDEPSGDYELPPLRREEPNSSPPRREESRAGRYRAPANSQRSQRNGGRELLNRYSQRFRY